MAQKAKAIQITDEDKLKRFTNLLTQDISVAEGALEPILAEIHADREAYNAKTKSKPLWNATPEVSAAPQITIPKIKSATLALKSEVYPTLIDINLIMRVLTILKKNQRFSEKMERFYQQLYIEIEYATKMKKAISAAVRDRTSIVEAKWCTKKFYKNMIAMSESVDEAGTPIVEFDENGEPQPVIEQKPTEELTTYYDYPELVIHDIENFMCFPAVDADIQESPGIGIKCSYSGYELLEYIEEGIFDKEATRKVLKTPRKDLPSTAEDTRDKITSGQLQIDNPSMPEKSVDWNIYGNQTYNLIDIYYRYEANRDWLITMDLDSNTILRAAPSPYWGSRRKFTAIRPYSNDGGIFADSISTIGGKETQEAISQCFTMSIAQSLKWLFPSYFMPMMQIEHMNKMKNKNSTRIPGGYIPMPLEMSPSDMKIADQTASPTSILPVIQLLNDFQQNAVGINDVNQGGNFAPGTTATETVASMESAKKITGGVISNCSTGMVEIQQNIHELTIQFADRELMQKLWDDVNNEGNDVDSVPMTQEVEVAKSTDEIHLPYIGLDEALEIKYNFVANGSFATSRMIQAKKALEVFGLLGGMLDALGMTEEKYNLILWVLSEQGVNNAEQLMGDKDTWIAMTDAMRAMQGMPTVKQVMTPQPAGIPQMPPAGLPQGDMPASGQMPALPEMPPTMPQGGIPANGGMEQFGQSMPIPQQQIDMQGSM